MQQVIHFLLKTTNWILVGVLGLLGISCGGPEDEYGTPYSTYALKGKVTDTENNGLEKIQVYLQQNEYPFFGIKEDTVYTDANGDFTYEWMDFPADNTSFSLIARDKNGIFEPDTTTVTFQKEDLKGGKKNWFFGSASKELVITLKKSPTDSNEEKESL